MAYMDYIDHTVLCLRKVIKLNHSLTLVKFGLQMLFHLEKGIEVFFGYGVFNMK